MTDQNDYTVPSNPADRKKIKDRIAEMSGALQKKADAAAFMKDVATSLKEDFGIPPKISNKMAKTLYKHDYLNQAQESEQFSLFYETLFQGSTSSPVTSEEDDAP